MPKRVVSNTTPILSLLKIDHLELLHQLYGEINIPQAVWQEIEGHAERYGLIVTGTLGILLKAKQKGFINAVNPLIRQLQAEGIWLDKSLINLVLSKAGETDN